MSTDFLSSPASATRSRKRLYSPALSTTSSATTLNSASTLRLTPHPGASFSQLTATPTQSSTFEGMSSQPSASPKKIEEPRTKESSSLSLSRKAVDRKKRAPIQDEVYTTESPDVMILDPPPKARISHSKPIISEIEEVPKMSTSKEPGIRRKDANPKVSNHAGSEAIKPSKTKKSKKKPRRITDVDPTSEENLDPKEKPVICSKPVAKEEHADRQGDRPRKKKKLTFQDQVFKHMLSTFKPFTLKTLAGELKTTSEALNYLMLSLVDKGLVTRKDFTNKSGKVKTLYWANYGAKAKEVQVELASSEEIGETHRLLKAKETELLSMQRTLRDVESELSNQEINDQLETTEREVSTLKEDLESMKTRIASLSQPQTHRRGPPKTKAQLASERCPHRLKKRINHMRKEWKTRKDKCKDFVDQLADGLEKKPKDIVKLLDVETDEDAGATIPPKQDVDAN